MPAELHDDPGRHTDILPLTDGYPVTEVLRVYLEQSTGATRASRTSDRRAPASSGHSDDLWDRLGDFA